MGLFHRKSDPIAEKKRALNEQIAQLEARIKELSTQPASPAAGAKPVAVAPAPSLAVPAAPQAPKPPAPAPPTAVAPAPNPLPTRKATPKPTPLTEPAPAAEMYNEMGVRKFDLADLIRRIINSFKTPPPANPHLVKYLASGGLPGMRALRYEKRVARNRFIGLVAGFLILLWIILTVILRNR